MPRDDADYLVVGAGTAGCVVAARLSEDPSVKVTLLEAGPRDTRRELRLASSIVAVARTELDWAFETEPQEALQGRRLYWPRGKVVGGSGALNSLVYIRGNRLDYDGWAALGATGWSYEEVLPWFRRSEDHPRGPTRLHGRGGPWPVEDQANPHELSLAFVRAANELGFPTNPDFNGHAQEGFGLYALNLVRGERRSTAVCFLRPALSRKNLRLETDVLVLRLCFERARCVGVVVLDASGKTRALRAAREVILTAGAIGSPVLLLRSGIGPAEDLARIGVRVVMEAPEVGRHLQDHLLTPVNFHCTRPITLERARSPLNVLRWLAFRSGPLATTGPQAGGFLRTDESAAAPDLQYHFVPVQVWDHGTARAPAPGFSICPTLLHPQSAGTITLRDADPRTPPRIDPGYLREKADVDVLVRGVKLARELVTTRALREYTGAEASPGSRVQGKQELRAWVRSAAETVYHPVGTCRMGSDPTSVVDPELRVRGVDGLRVADASVMPRIVRGNTNAPVVMIAERCAAFVGARQAPRLGAG